MYCKIFLEFPRLIRQVCILVLNLLVHVIATELIDFIYSFYRYNVGNWFLKDKTNFTFFAADWKEFTTLGKELRTFNVSRKHTMADTFWLEINHT